MRNAGRAVRSAVRQQLLVVKVRFDHPLLSSSDAGFIPLLTFWLLFAGRRVHYYRAGHLPAGMWYQPRLVLDLALPRGYAPVASGVLPVCAVDGDVLSLGSRDNVHVGSFVTYYLYDFVLTENIVLGINSRFSWLDAAPSCVRARCGSSRTPRTRTSILFATYSNVLRGCS